ncbi:MAG: hypothetical protein ACI870_000593 [Crocinitomicaceae bacterium]|jgi:hypothetical protein
MKNIKKSVPLYATHIIKHSDELVVVRFLKKNFAILRKDKKDWYLGSLKQKGNNPGISLFNKKPILSGNAFKIKSHIIPLSKFLFLQKVFLSIRLDICFVKKEFLVSIST